jgi:two-component system NtrC family response regulator
MLSLLDAFNGDYTQALVRGNTRKAFATALNAACYYEEQGDVEGAGVWHRETSFLIYLQSSTHARRQSRSSLRGTTAARQKLLSLLGEAKRQALYLNFYESYKALLRAEEISRPARDDDFLQAEIHACKAFCFTRVGDSERAIANYEKAVRLMMDAGEFRRTASILNSLGFWSTAKRQFERAEQYLLQGLELSAGHQDPYLRAALTDSLGFTYVMMKRLDDTERLLTESNGIFAGTNDMLSRISSMLRLSAFHSITGSYTAARQCAGEAVTLAAGVQCDPLLAQAKRQLARFERQCRSKPATVRQFHSMVYCSGAMEDVVLRVRAIAPTNEVVLILGETGVGKELVARAIHSESDRRGGPFVTFNCSTISRELAESRLFGHRKGAFTGADQDQRGIVRAAGGGSLFLDEIGDLPLEAQGALLRLLQAGEIQPVGESRPVKVDVRVIAATNRSLKQDADNGVFRKDLYHRLSVVTLALPTLRSRPEDIMALANHFRDLNTAAYGLGEPAWSEAELNWLTRYEWPGNVRELENYVKQRILLGSVELRPNGAGRKPWRDDKPESSVWQPESRTSPVLSARPRSWRKLTETEKQACLSEVLDSNGGNVSAAARQLGISRRAVQKLLRRSEKREVSSSTIGERL